MKDMDLPQYRVFVAITLILPVSGLAAGQARESPYDMVMRLRREAATKKNLPESAVVGAVVAKAELKLVPPARGSPTGFLALRRYDTTRVKPQTVKDVPADAPREPFWFVVRVGDVNVPGATYASSRMPGQVVFCLDTDGDGLLSDERGYRGVRSTLITYTPTYEFGPVYLRQGTPSPGGDAFYVQCTNGEWFTLWPAFYREGQVVLNGKGYRIALVDSDFDGRFNESFAPPAADSRDPSCDVLAIDLDGDSKYDYGQPGESEVMPLSELVTVGGQCYRIDVSDDGGTVEFSPAQPAFGYLDLGGKEVVLGLWSDAAQQRPCTAGGKLQLPVGRYSLVTMDLMETDSASRWVFKMAKGGAGPLKDFEIKPGQTTAFQVGPPFQIRTSMQRYGRSPDVTVGFEFQGQGGERYTSAPTRNGKEAPAPSLKIRDGAGQVVQSGQFAYG